MPAYSKICLRLETLKYDALSKVVAEKNTTVENLLQSKLGELYLEYVPADLQKQISAELAVIFHEEAETKRRRAERERETVLKLRDVGFTWWLGHTTLSDLRIAVRLKQVLRFCPENPAGSFCANLRAKCYISEKEFDSKTIDYLQGKTTTTNSVVLDFEENTVTMVQPRVGRTICRMSDVSTAADRACRSQKRTEEEKEIRFYKALEGKALQTIPWEEAFEGKENN